MPPAPRTSPFDGTEKVIIDGTNLLFRLGSGAGGPAPPPAGLGRLRGAVPLGVGKARVLGGMGHGGEGRRGRGAVPMAIAIDRVVDGMGHGVYGRLAQKMAVRYSGRRPADDVILDLASEFAMQHGGAAASDKVLVVTNDRGLRDHLAAKGARTAPLQWLIGKLDVPAPTSLPGQGRRPSIGVGRPPRSGPGGTGAAKDDEARTPWKPGRGATAKSGTPNKVARHKRHPRQGG